MKSAIAFFDVDQTLIKGYCGYTVVRNLIKKGMIKKRRVIQAFAYKSIGRLFRKLDVKRMYEIVMSDLAGFKMKEIMQIGEEIFNQQVKPLIYQEAIKEVKKQRNLGHKIAFISSGPQMAIQPIEKFFHADRSFSISPQIKEGVLQKEIIEPLCYEEGKVILAEQYANENQTELKDCLFYSDSISDLPLLEKVGKAHAVNPDKFLFREAQKRHWPILNFHKLLGIQAPDLAGA
ncbi:MAG: HAD-IB family hydrolase [Deltaproteobacteria bacterium]|nr:HAD-IB family hydrolase [Deltaproteobacteria bacterium]